MFQSPYSTTPMSSDLMTKTTHQVTQALVEERLVHPVPELKHLFAVFGRDSASQQIPAFTHPITIMYRNEPVTVIDLRPYENTITQLPEGLLIAKETPAAFLVKIATLQMIWQSDAPKFDLMIDLPLAAYSTWIGNTLTRALGLDPAVSFQVRALAAWFFMCLHTEAFEINDSTIASKVKKISIQTTVPSETVIDVIRKAGFLNNIKEFAQALTELPSAKLGRVNAPFLFQMLGNGWFGGADARSLVAVALEFPPYFYGIVHSATADRFYRKAAISMVVENMNRGDRFRVYDVQLRRLLEEGI